MLGIILLLVLSSILAFFLYRKIDVLGIVPDKKRMLYFFIGLLFAAVLTLFNIFIESTICSIQWKINHPVNWLLLRKAVCYYFIAALTEELVFRGFILYFLTKKINVQTAMLISAVCFGCYHWFSYEMLGSGIVPMAFVFLITGLAGYVWAYAFIKSNTIWLPLGLHFSWNMMHSLFAGKAPYGSILYSQISKIPLSDTTNLFLSLFKNIFPAVIMYLALYFFFSKKKEC